MTVIYHSYAWYIPEILRFYTRCVFTANATMKLQPQVRFCIYTCIPRRGASRNSSDSIFSRAFIYERYMNGIWTSYLFRWTPPLRRHASGPAGSSKRALTFRTLNVCEYLRFWPPKVHQLEAGACQSSTARCWSHTHGCPCAIPGPRRQRTRIRRPASVEEHTCMEL